MKKLSFVLFGLFTLLLLFSCGKESTEDLVVLDPVVEENLATVEEEPEINLEPIETEPEIIDEPVLGYRVQIYAFEQLDLAEKKLEELKSQLDENVYLQTMGNYFKIRVGNFMSEADAQSLRKKLVSIGFSDAFIVESEIEQ